MKETSAAAAESGQGTGQNRPVNTPKRNIRISDELWQKATEKAERRHEPSVTAVIVRLLWAWVEEDDK